jgi:hypothetical protein
MDNAVAEYSFVTAFFNVQTKDTSTSSSQEQRGALFSPTSPLFPGQGGFADRRSHAGSDFGGNAGLEIASEATRNATKAEQASLDAIWKHVLDPVLEYCQVYYVHLQPFVCIHLRGFRLLSGLFSTLFRRSSRS